MSGGASPSASPMRRAAPEVGHADLPTVRTTGEAGDGDIVVAGATIGARRCEGADCPGPQGDESQPFRSTVSDPNEATIN